MILLHDEAVKCPTCGLICNENELSEILFEGKKYYVCPECLTELLNTCLEHISDSEVDELNAFDKADEDYLYMKESGVI